MVCEFAQWNELTFTNPLFSRSNEKWSKIKSDFAPLNLWNQGTKVQAPPFGNEGLSFHNFVKKSPPRTHPPEGRGLTGVYPREIIYC
jgi:hypothetical protein